MEWELGKELHKDLSIGLFFFPQLSYLSIPLLCRLLNSLCVRWGVNRHRQVSILWKPLCLLLCATIGIPEQY